MADKSGKEKLLSCNCVTGLPFSGVALNQTLSKKLTKKWGLEEFDTIGTLERNISVCNWYYPRAAVKFGYELDITDIEVIGESDCNHSKEPGRTS